MTATPIANLEALLAKGKDGPLLRFGLGGAYLNAADPQRAAQHLAEAVRLAPRYSAAWKLLGKALAEAGRWADALAAYRQGIAAAEQHGDKQAAREMTVFARRIEKQLGTPSENPGSP